MFGLGLWLGLGLEHKVSIIAVALNRCIRGLMKHIKRARLLIPTTLGSFGFGIHMGYAAYSWPTLPCFGVAPGSALMLIWTSARRWETLFVVVTDLLMLSLPLLWLLVVVDTDYGLRVLCYELWAIGLLYC